MKTFLIGFGAAVFAAGFLQADMVVVQKVEGAGQNGEMTMKFKGSTMRIDVSPQVSVLTDLSTGAMTTLMHPQKVYMKIDPAAMKQMLANVQKKTDAEEPKLQSTGRHEKINGIDTEVFTSKSGGVEATYWIAKDYPEGDKLMALLKEVQESTMTKMARDIAPQPKDLPGVPVKTEVEAAPGQKVTTTLVSAKEETLSDADFKVPEGYQAMTAPSFPGAPQ